MYFIVGQIYKERELVGYRILDLASHLVKDIKLDDLRNIMLKPSNKNLFVNAYYKYEARLLVGTQGSLTEYQRIFSNGVLDRKKKLCICYAIADKDTGKITGYGVADGYGMLVNVRTGKLIELCSKYDMSNFTLSGSTVKSNGEDFLVVKMKVIEKNVGYNSKLGEKSKEVCSEIKDSVQSNKLPTINVYSYNDIKVSEFGVVAQEKMFKAYSNMKKLSPYYHTVLSAIKREATLAVPTLAVTEDTMYYNLEFVSSLTVSELTFILIHEIQHIAGRHSYRHGSRDNGLWNIACDLYINSIIARDFDIYFGGGEKELDTPQGKAVIKVPENGIHLSTIGETLDYGVDTPETIYARLVKENPPQPQQNQGGSGQQSGQQSGRQSQQGQSQSDNQQGQGQSQGQQSQGSSQGQRQGGNLSSSEDSLNSKGNSVSTDRSTLAQEGTDVEQNSKYEKPREITVTYNGKKLTGTISMDVMTSEIGDSKDRDQRMNEKSLDVIQKMKTGVEVKEEELGTSLVKNAGMGANLMQRCIEFGLSTQVNWKVYLANMCKSKPKKMYTMASPNEVYMNSGITLASRRKIGKPTAITGIKVCIDVSGSVSEKELNYYLSEVNNILKHYEVEGELIYWSTMIGDAGKFSDLKDMLKISPKTDGGTNVKCVFDYLARKTRVNAKYEETLIKDITCVLIFTDGVFSNNYAEYAKYFGKKVIWVVPDSRWVFNPPFGKIAIMD